MDEPAERGVGRPHERKTRGVVPGVGPWSPGGQLAGEGHQSGVVADQHGGRKCRDGQPGPCPAETVGEHVEVGEGLGKGIDGRQPGAVAEPLQQGLGGLARAVGGG